jgi:predicted nucleic acid-binding protein
MKIFLDTNIVLDFLDDKRLKNREAIKIIENAIINKNKLVISEDILTTVYYIAKKTVSRKRILVVFEMIVSEFLIVNFGKNVIKKSIKLCQRSNKSDFEDVSQAVCAESHQCDMIITNDKNFPKLKVPVKTAEEFVGERKNLKF